MAIILKSSVCMYVCLRLTLGKAEKYSTWLIFLVMCESWIFEIEFRQNILDLFSNVNFQPWTSRIFW
jgi:hypothetical protein